MKVGLVQFDSVWQDSYANIEKLTEILQASQCSKNFDLLVLPETFHAGFSMNPSTFAESLEGEISQALSKLAKTYEVNLVAGVAQKQIRQNCEGQRAQYFNRALCFNSQGDVTGSYSKQKLFSYAGENQVFQAGFKPKVIQINGQPFALFICYDLRFPELFREVAREVKGFIIIANWPSSRQVHWETLLKARAIENQCFVIAVNRIGKDDNGLSYAGGSMVVSPLGEVLAYGEPQQTMIEAQIDTNEVEEVRKQFPFLDDM